jgi:hypothetical protein
MVQLLVILAWADSTAAAKGSEANAITITGKKRCKHSVKLRLLRFFAGSSTHALDDAADVSFPLEWVELLKGGFLREPDQSREAGDVKALDENLVPERRYVNLSKLAYARESPAITNPGDEKTRRRLKQYKQRNLPILPGLLIVPLPFSLAFSFSRIVGIYEESGVGCVACTSMYMHVICSCK